MGIIDIASSKSVWRGMDYYKQKKVLSCEENEDGTYEGDVPGSKRVYARYPHLECQDKQFLF